MSLRSVMSKDIPKKLSGIVEIDESWIGGKDYFRGKKWWANWNERPKQIAMGMVERKGKVKTVLIRDTDGLTLMSQIKKNIDPKARVVTDGHYGYKLLPRYGYKHASVNHSIHYVDKKNPLIHTNSIEGFWGQMKRGITGVYRHVSRDYLQNYMDEYAFRYNHRHNPGEMFSLILNKIVT